MADKFASILDRPATEIERPKPLPPGTYRCLVKGLPRYDKSSKKQTEFVEFTLTPTAAESDVNEEDLAAMGGFQGKEIRATYYLTEDAAWRLKNFLEHCGFDIEDSEHTLREMCEQAAGSEVYATLKHRASQDGKSVFAELADTAKVD
jgi:hypothetical protein